MEIACEEVVRRYRLDERTVLALEGVTCRFESGELVVVTGKSGSGKTTLLNIVGGLERPSSGRVRVDGEDLFARGDRELSRYRGERIGFVFQSFHLNARQTALENVLVPFLFADRRPRDPKERGRAVLAEVDLEEQADQRAGTLSAGQKQRVAIARALVREPDFVLADEPTGNLDADTGGGIISLLRRLIDERGIGGVIVTHDPAITSVADRSLHLVEGRLAPASAA